ncbi:ABC transporter permease subunit [Jiella sp. MQZ9-1]|uniref:sn-glycerol-3-phosphate transport system permease protein UgpE n=1 Tax=Jiella flava TaxID=2816857 RepID=A0A939JVH4_9HYPH|nr:ABC transporter permease subunit [Jiella flava]MBO0662464.1 ABC transporter permease subunit [Jiella flava]MCD2471689.1 ABC transporter permease subunit [Jiella flava]
MIETTRSIDRAATIVLAIGILFALGPFYLVVTTATSTFATVVQGMPLRPGTALFANLHHVLFQTDIPQQVINSMIIAVLVTSGKAIVSVLSAFAIVYFDLKGKTVIFGMILATMMMPIEVRIVSTYAVASNVFTPFQDLIDITGVNDLIEMLTGMRLSLEVNLLNTYVGMALPLIATATGTFLFRQFFQSIPRELSQAARMDGAGPVRFLIDILLPLSKAPLGALTVIMFESAWNQLIWPLMIATDPRMEPAVVGLTEFQTAFNSGQSPEYQYMMAAALLVIIPPLIVIALLQRLIVRGLVIGEK